MRQRQSAISVSVCWFLVVLTALASSAAADPAPASVDFNREVRPILSDKCFACHGPDEGQRQVELRLDTKEGAFADRGGYQVIVPGKKADSRLYQRISHDQEIARMPPPGFERQLESDEVDLIGRWIDQGADWQTHWAYVPPKRPELPEVSKADWPRNGIDHFVLARLDREGLQPAPPADKATLLRRVTFDLTGLPPTPERIDSFLADDSPYAYEKRVEALLNSRHYGERMAMQWLDLARYADTHGYHIDSHRDMWHWRDWVINAFNSNKPFDVFTVEQLAGDLLPNPTNEQIIATGFNRNHMINFEGGAIPEEYQTEYVVDRVETTATVWMAATLGCSRCHDHKYDPFKQSEFYRFFAFFNTIPEQGLDGRTGNAAPVIELPSTEQQRRKQELKREIAATEDELGRDRMARLQADWEKTARSTVPPPAEAGLIAHFPFDDDLADKRSGRQGKTVRGEVVYEDSGVIGKAVSFSRETHADFGMVPDFDRSDEFSLAFWMRSGDKTGMQVLHKLEDAESRRGWEFWVDEFEKIGEMKRGQHLFFRMTSRWPGDAIEIRSARRIEQGAWHHVTVTYDGSGKAAGLKLYVDGKPEQIEVTRDTLSGTIRTAQPLGSGNKQLGEPFKGRFDDFRAFDRVLAADEVASLGIHHAVREVLAEPIEGCPEYVWRPKDGEQPADEPSDDDTKKKNRECKARQEKLRDYYLTHVAPEPIQKLYAELKALDQRLEDLEREIPTSMVMREMGKPRETFVLQRGDYRNKTDRVEAGVPAVLNPLPADAQQNRLGLAKWLVDPSNPLTARVTVNRYWQMYFGTGLVRTSEDFGSQGEPPSHPELLDWLATEFVQSGWDVKKMQKLIVTSSTYRQSSRIPPEMLEKDPHNRLLSRGPRFRLSAEMIRDNALAVSGLLNREIGGPSVYPYQPPGLWEEMAFGDVFSAQAYTPSRGKDLYRRSMYTFWKRTVPPATLATFDAPDREECTPRRARTNTPLQALILMNDPTYIEASRHLAQRMIQEAGDDPSERVRWAFRRATAREPSQQETGVLLSIAREQQNDYRGNPDAARELLTVGESEYASNLDPVELAAWTTAASTILNLDETVTKE